MMRGYTQIDVCKENQGNATSVSTEYINNFLDRANTNFQEGRCR